MLDTTRPAGPQASSAIVSPDSLRRAIDSALSDAEAARSVRNFKDATEKVYEAFGLAAALGRLERSRVALCGTAAP